MADEKPIPQWRKMTEAEAKLAAKDQIKTTKAQTKATDKLTDTVKKQTKEHARQPRMAGPQGPRVELGKETRKEILSALKNIRSQIVISQQRESTATDVAAEHLAGGGGLIGAAGAAVSFKAGKAKAAFKRKFDPLNIVHRMTGGSKLATVLAGKIMGRSEKSIRGAAGLAGGIPPGMEEQGLGAPSPYMGGGEPSPVSSDKATGLLEQMASSLAVILKHITELTTSSKKIEEYTHIGLAFTKTQAGHLEEMKDSAAEEKARFKGTATQVTKGGVVKGAEKEGGGLLDMLMKALFGPLGLAFAGLIAAGVLLYRQWDKLKLSFSLLGDSINDVWESIKGGLVSISKWVEDSLIAVSDSILDAGESMIEGVKSFLPGYMAPTEAEKQKTLEATAAGGGFGAARAQRKLAAQNIDKTAAPGETAAAVAKFAPTFATKVPADTKKNTAEALQRGDYDAAATGALLGTTPMTGTDEQKATTGAITQLVAKSYGEVFKDAQGKPLSPMTDTKENRERRVPEMVKEASKAISRSLISGAPTPAPAANNVPGTQTITPAATAPTELQAPAPMTGHALEQSQEFQRTSAMMPAPGVSGAPTIINNVKNNNTNSSTIHQNMAGARSDESSYLRWLDRDYVHA